MTSRIVHMSSVHTALDNRILFKECSSLAAFGYDVHLVAQIANAEKINGVSIQPLPKPSNRFFRFFLTVLKCFTIGKGLNGDLYHLHDPELIPVGLILKFIFRKKIIFDMHENLPKAILSKQWIYPYFRQLIAMVLWFFERVVLNQVHVIFAEDSYRKDYGFVKSWVTVHNFPKVSHLEPINAPKHEIFSVIYLGTVSDARGFQVMLSAIEKINSVAKPVDLHIVGAYSDDQGKKASELNSRLRRNAIHLHGFKRAHEAYDIVAKCHVGLAVLQPIPNYFESYPTKIFEYMALGLRIVTSDFPLYRTVVHDNRLGKVIEPNSEALQKCLNEMSEDEDDLGKQFVDYRKTEARKYSWEKEATILTNFVQKILSAN